MAIPQIPFQFIIQQSDGRVLTSWGICAGATGYSVQRSVDGVNFTVVGTPTTNNFLDTTVTANTMYYYNVASVNGSGTSGYTSALQVVPTLSGQLSLFETRLRVLQRADRLGSTFVSIPEINFAINQAWYELYDLLITVYEDYYVAPRLSIQTTGNQQNYALPDGLNNGGAPAFYKAYGLDLGLDNSQNAWVTLKKFDFISRNRYVYPQLTTTLLGVFNLQYRIVGGNIMFIPIPSGGQTIGLWYFPRLTRLLQDTDVMDTISGWNEYVIVRSAKYVLDKEESDTDKLDAELLFLKSRIEAAASNRDAGQGDTVSNTRTQSERWGNYGAPNGDGSYGGY